MDAPPLIPGVTSGRAATTARAPVIVAVDDERDALARVEHELQRRYGGDYRIVCERRPLRALERLEEMREEGDDVAIVLADQWMPGCTGAELLSRVRDLHPSAKRAMLIEFGDWGERRTADALLQAMAMGQIDYYVLKPWRSPDELFHRTMAEFVHEWSRGAAPGPREVVLVGPQWSRRSHELRSFVARSGVPHAFHASDSPEGRRVLASLGRTDGDLPLAVTHGGRVLVDPSTAELAAAYGVRTELPDDRDFDAVVVGAGPGGMAAAVYGGSEGLRTLGVERDTVGGQAGSSSLIRNYLGFPRGISGADLAQRAYQQAWVLGAEFLLTGEVVGLSPGEERHTVVLADGEVTARAVVLATGVAYRRLGVPSLEALSGAGVFYGASVSEAQALAGARVFVVGGGNSAGQAAMHLGRFAESVTILVRDTTLATTMSHYLRDEIDAAANIDVRYRTEAVGGSGDGRLRTLTIRDDAAGTESEEEADALFVLIGARPHTEWLPEQVRRDERGFVYTGRDLTGERKRDWPLDRLPLALETSVPRVFAVGDVRHASIKRVASAVGEGSVVISQVIQCLQYEQENRRPAARSAGG
jgi:thioredoxin reductase (NADPH)